jgi:hypothetical protein
MKIICYILAFAATFSLTVNSMTAQNSQNKDSLAKSEQALVAISALTAQGDWAPQRNEHVHHRPLAQKTNKKLMS